MATLVSRQFARLRILGLIVPLITGLVTPLSAAPSRPERSSERCQECSECASNPARPRVVGLKIYNQQEISEAGLDRILEVANRIWKPYGVNIEPSASRDAIAVVVSRATSAAATDFHPAVLGDTLFNRGHATPYIHLWPGNAEALAIGSEMDGRPFTSMSQTERDAILLRMMGVALAHELGHYLLDTAEHSAAGLLRQTISVDDLAFPRPGHLRLTNQQQRLMCLEGNTDQ